MTIFSNFLIIKAKALKERNCSILKKIKRKYSVKKAGYSGTLDPFAVGVLIVAFGQYAKLFNYLSKSPKTYQATLYLGAYSPTLDNEQIEKIDEIEKIDGVFVVVGDKVGIKGKIPELVKTDKKITLGELFEMY